VITSRSATVTGVVTVPIGRRLAAAVVVVATAAAGAGCSRPADGPAAEAPVPLPPTCPGGRGTDVTTKRDQQRILVHLPPCYDEHPDVRFPVILLIHGASADETQWTDIGMTTEADRLVVDGEIAPSILVMPDFRDTAAAREAQVVVDRVVPWVDAQYRTLRDPGHRAVGGISRGGGAALVAAAMRPDVFGSVAAHSPAISGNLDQLRDGLTALGGSIRIDVGADDGLRDSAVRFADSLTAAGIDVELRVDPGGHDRAYWRAHVDEYLRFTASRWR
jgi:enterochelin esterase-like enzyme